MLFVARDSVAGREPFFDVLGAGVEVLGAACGPTGVASLRSSDPVLGASLRFEGYAGTAGQVAAMLIGPMAAPFNLGSGCWLHTNPASALVLGSCKAAKRKASSFTRRRVEAREGRDRLGTG